MSTYTAVTAALEFAETGVRINVVAPGTTENITISSIGEILCKENSKERLHSLRAARAALARRSRNVWPRTERALRSRTQRARTRAHTGGEPLQGAGGT